MTRVTVITPTTGHDKVVEAIDSVRNQDYTNHVRHIVVVDGNKFKSKFLNLYKENIPSNIELIVIPDNTGRNGINGQLIYASFSQLLDTDYIFYLDEDNTYESNHISTIVKAFETNPSWEFCYSLRNIIEYDGSFVTEDLFESVGDFAEIVDYNLMDTSTIAIRKNFLRQNPFAWYDGGVGEDRNFYNKFKNVPHGTTGKFTLNYRLSGKLSKEFFISGSNYIRENTEEHTYGTMCNWVS